MILRSLPLLLLASPALLAAPVPATSATVLVVDQVDDLIRRGRTELEAGKAEAALLLFEEAAAKDSGLRTRVWILRARMNAGFLNDILGEIDSLAEAGEGVETNYLYGMAFAIKAQQAISSGITDGTVGMQMMDAQTYLGLALEEAGDRFSDGYPVMATIAWMNQDLDAAIAASDKAIGFYPKGAAVLVQRGKIQLSRFVANQADEEKAEAVAAMGADAVASFDKALAVMGTKKDDGRANERADAWKQLGDMQAWLGDQAASAQAYAHSMSWDPTIHDYGSLWGRLGERFIPTLTSAKDEFAQRWGKRTSSDATLLWYLGYARLMQNDADNYELGEQELIASVEKFPTYLNAYYYVCQLRAKRFDYMGAADIMVEFWERDRANVVATLSNDLPTAREYLDYIVGQCVNEGRLLTAATLSEMLGHSDLKEGHLDFSYKGLFLRDHADLLLRGGEHEWGDEELMAFYEESLGAYGKALELDPENPNYQNDLAVVLHYNLRREYDRALELYDAAQENAKRLMEDETVPLSRKEQFISIALRDSGNNARMLRRQLKKWEEDAEKERKEKEGEDAGA